jgi:hypothetical protein
MVCDLPMLTITGPSVQSLLLQMHCNGHPIATGTGFVAMSARGPVLITNRHNVTGRNPQTGQFLSAAAVIPDAVLIVHNRAGRLGEWVGVTEPLLDLQDNPLWIDHPLLGEKADFVALPLTQLSDVQLYPYNLDVDGPRISVGPAEVVSVVGFPFGVQAGGSLAVWATGFVASEPVIDFNDLPIFLIDCRSRPGQSGSAVIAYRGGGSVSMEDGSTAIFGGPITRFLGVYSGRINEQSDIGIVWKAEAIRQLVDSIT